MIIFFNEDAVFHSIVLLNIQLINICYNRAARIANRVFVQMKRSTCVGTLGIVAGPILSVFFALIVHSELKSVHPGFPVAFIF